MNVRPLNETDYELYLPLINSFRETNFSKNIFKEILDKINNNNSTIWIIEEGDKIIGSGTLLYEYKFIRNISKCAHIEDIIISKEYRSKQYGKKLIQHLIQEAQKNDCYKIILNCNNELEHFYNKCGLNNNGISMSLYF
jgi:glucosamine-phosphate N-acetyltransferase